MPNKIKDIFSDDMFNIEGQLRFRNEEAYKNFMAALEIAQAEGRAVPVEGVIAITTQIWNQGAKYPLDEYTHISDFAVGPAVETLSIPIKVGDDKKTMTFLRRKTADKIILESEPNSIVSFKFIFMKSENRHTVNYKVQFEHARDIEDIAESFASAAAFLSTIYEQENEQFTEKSEVSIADVKEYFRHSEAFLKRFLSVEKELGLSFSPTKLNDLSVANQHDIDELYLLLCQKQAMRVNAKLIPTGSITMSSSQSNEKLNVGSKIKLAFLGSSEYTLFEQNITLHTANLLLNAVVEEAQEDGDTLKILYGDTDSKPMYIAFTAFKTQDEAKKEADVILEHEKHYADALTSNEYIKQLYSSI